MHRSLTISAVLGVFVLALSGCATVVTGQGSAAQGVRANVAPSDFDIVGASNIDADTQARNALADLNTFWQDSFPTLFGTDFTPLSGGYYSVDPKNFDASAYPNDIGCFDGPSDVQDNAFYCFDGDDIVYDRDFIANLASQYGRFIPALVMAHEFGHAVQGRQPPDSQLSIVFETQADCYAGAWSKSVSEGKAKHFLIRPSELDQVIRGYLLLRDKPGRGATDESAHGSYFDRVSAFQQGFDDGAQSCVDNFNAQRTFTQTEFTSQQDLDNGGNAPYADALTITQTTLEGFWKDAFQTVFGKTYQPPKFAPFDGTVPECDGKRQRRDLTFCEPEQRVDFDNTTLMPAVYDQIGDYAVSTLIATQYAQSARDQLGLDFRGVAALRSSICLSGWYARAFYDGTIPDATATISPGDVDEAIQALLDYGNQTNVLPDIGLSGFQQVDLFRQGFLRGAPACDVGA